MSKHDHDLGADLATWARRVGRRDLLRLLAGASVLPIFGCGANAISSLDLGGGDGGSCATLPEETAGPYPGDGSNGPNALTQSGIVRSDIRSSFGSMSGTADGVTLTVKLTLLDVSAGCAPLAGYAIYLWHCDRAGLYSLYTIASQNYLRGVQTTDASGTGTFTTIFPGAYLGRWPHIHFEVYPSLASASSSSAKIKTSQLALPSDACNQVYASSGYEQSAINFPQTQLAGDNVFSDGVTLQLASVAGSVSAGYVANLALGI